LLIANNNLFFSGLNLKRNLKCYSSILLLIPFYRGRNQQLQYLDNGCVDIFIRRKRKDEWSAD